MVFKGAPFSPAALSAAALIAIAQMGGCPDSGAGPASPVDSASGTSLIVNDHLVFSSDEFVDVVLDELPDLSQSVGYTTPASDGPPDALFGYGVDLKRVFPLGRVTENGVEVSGVAIESLRSEVLLTVEATDDSLVTTLPGGHRVEVIALADGLRFEFLIETAEPPYALVAETDSLGNLTRAEQVSVSSLSARSRGEPDRKRVLQSIDLSCDALLNDLETGSKKLCELRSLLTSSGPALAVDRVCIGLSNLLDGVGTASDPPQVQQALAAAKIVLTGICELVKLGFRATDLSPWGLACLALENISNLSVSIDGETIASRACRVFGFGSAGVGAGTSVGSDDPNEGNDGDPPAGSAGRIEVLRYINSDCSGAQLGDADFDPARAELQVYFEGDTLVVDWPAYIELGGFGVSVLGEDDVGGFDWSAFPHSDEPVFPPVRIGECEERPEVTCFFSHDSPQAPPKDVVLSVALDLSDSVICNDGGQLSHIQIEFRIIE